VGTYAFHRINAIVLLIYPSSQLLNQTGSFDVPTAHSMGLIRAEKADEPFCTRNGFLINAIKHGRIRLPAQPS